MSHVRRCDKCSTIFSELEVGWQTYTATTVGEDEQGNQITVQQAMDACPACAFAPTRQFHRETRAAIEGNKREARIAQLERETGLDDETGTFEEPDESGLQKTGTKA